MIPYLFILWLTVQTLQPVETPKDTLTVFEKQFQKELQETVLEFIEDIGANPDTCYIPFKEKSKKRGVSD